MHTSSIRRTCSSSYPSRSPPSRADGRGAVGRTSRAREVSTSGKSVRTFSAVTFGAVVVTVALILAVDGSTWMLEMREILEIDGNTRGADMIIEGPQQDGDHARQPPRSFDVSRASGRPALVFWGGDARQKVLRAPTREGAD